MGQIDVEVLSVNMSLKALRPGRFALLLPLSLALSASAGEIRGRLLVSDRGDRPAAGVTVSAVAEI